MAASKSPKCFIKYTCLSSNSGNFASIDLGRDLGICIFGCVKVDSDAQSGLETIVLEHNYKYIYFKTTKNTCENKQL